MYCFKHFSEVVVHHLCFQLVVVVAVVLEVVQDRQADFQVVSNLVLDNHHKMKFIIFHYKYTKSCLYLLLSKIFSSNIFTFSIHYYKYKV